MREAHQMTLDELRAALDEAVDTSNWHLEDQAWAAAEWWHLRAVELGAEIERRSLH
jgi:hypothetical protein